MAQVQAKVQARTPIDEKFIKELFTMFDKNKNNKISSKEFELVLTAYSTSNLKKKEIADLMTGMGVKQGEEVPYEKFAVCISKYLDDVSQPGNKEEEEDKMRDAFKIFDKDKNGVISKAELKAALTNLGDKLTDAEVEDMFKLADADNDGKVTFKEFIKMSTKFMDR